MRAVQWETEILATWKRALDLQNICFTNGSLLLEVEEESGKKWLLKFEPTQAYKMTAEECAGNIISGLPSAGAMFIIQQSGWLQRLGTAEPLRKSQHFIICCYDEVIEVLAWNCSVTVVERHEKLSH